MPSRVSERRILAIDPGMASMGYGVVELSAQNQRLNVRRDVTLSAAKGL